MGTFVLLLTLAFIVFTVVMIVIWARAWQRTPADDLLVDLDAEAKELSELAAQKARALRDLRDLEFDFQVGHISEGDYNALRQRLEGRAIGIMKRLDALRGSTNFEALIDQGYAERFGVEPSDAPGSVVAEGTALAARAPTPAPAQAGVPASAPLSPSAPGAAIAHANGVSAAVTAPPVAAEVERRPCPSCGRSMERTAAFCSGCGTSLSPPKACASCGESLEDDARFCKRCGHPTDAPAPARVADGEAPPPADAPDPITTEA